MTNFFGKLFLINFAVGMVAAQARLLPWIQSLHQGWDPPAGALGMSMPGGERQRLAPALLADPAVLVLDEPGAHMDPANRRALTADLLAASDRRAAVLITRDVDGLDQVDETVVLDHGKVAERGTHRQLTAAGGLYWQMLELEGATI